MSLTDEEIATLVQLELKKANETFEEIEILTKANKWNGAANRLYYSVFHAISALLISDGHHVSTHSGSHALFNLYYIKTGILPNEYSKLYSQLQTLREESDYNCIYNVEANEISEKIPLAQELIKRINTIITNKSNI